MKNIILSNLGQDRCKGDGAKVLVDVLDRSFCLGTETISASFQDKGSRPSRKEVFIISMMGEAKRSVFSFKSYTITLGYTRVVARENNLAHSLLFSTYLYTAVKVSNNIVKQKAFQQRPHDNMGF